MHKVENQWLINAQNISIYYDFIIHDGSLIPSCLQRSTANKVHREIVGVYIGTKGDHTRQRYIILSTVSYISPLIILAILITASYIFTHIHKIRHLTFQHPALKSKQASIHTIFLI